MLHKEISKMVSDLPKINLAIAHHRPTDKYVDSQLIMISHDRLAQYWEVGIVMK